ncbi:MAG: flagellar basal body L-ring protein FlgH [Aquabacterium sp.]|jgi:flagellar L-ring protein precursor FlgH|uniref:flagellar basal body L-ring protein FlgH n=1 Tax=Aquabacterium sp. TaxID=1872578 RepID=UPI001B3D4B80|nr:flagellar basal body L-ring protein FlgH [Aquabacterium sp.]MBP7132835.1 flagellar basal body L-ring protein FlgH [Aquabacterium sp.]MBP9062900.1 flagellar basal body L-ring protein FlgH [Aquabacterium sp.]
MKYARPLLALAVLPGLLLGGCVTLNPKVDVLEPTQTRPVAVVQQPATNGAIFQSAGYRPLYETHRARMVGDIVTIEIDEVVEASQSKTNSIQKGGSLSAKTKMPLGASILSKIDADLPNLDASASSSNNFSGKGNATSDNEFKGVITATVIDVLPNGHLVVSGEKQIGVGSNVDILRFSGQIDPVTIRPGNLVASTQVANVRLEQRGQGAQQESQGIGWLGRFFLSIAPF